MGGFALGGPTELQRMQQRNWQRVGSLHRMLGQFMQLALVHPRLAPIAKVANDRIRLEIAATQLEYETIKQQYLDTHPAEAVKYYKAKARESSRKRDKKGAGKSNETN